MSSKDTYWHWSCRDNSTKIDVTVKSAREEVTQHPLLRSITTVPKVHGKKAETRERISLGKDSSHLQDPLSKMLDGDDPLSLFQRRAAENLENDNDWTNDDTSNKSAKYKFLQPWSAKRDEILAQINQDTSSKMNCFSLLDKGGLVTKTDRDDFEDGIIFEVNDMTPSDFARRMQSYHDDVIRAWQEDQRVKAIKIVIQCSKLLSDTLAYSFYPNKFVYVTDILDTFGNLVYTRLKAKCEKLWKPNTFNGKYLKTFPENFTAELVPDLAKETCHNWFFKIASIRELIPRLAVEIALLRSYTFIKIGEYEQILSRLTKMIRGVGDPLVNIYLRCYLCRVATQHCSECNYNIFAENFFEYVSIYPTIFANTLVVRKVIDVSRYIESFTPPLEWIVHGLIADDESVQYSLFDSFQRTPHNSLLLLVMMSSFRSQYVISQTPLIFNWIQECDHDEVPVHKFVRQLGHCFEKHKKENIGVIGTDTLDAMWTLIHQVDNTYHYMACVQQWLPLSIKNLPVKRIDFLLGNIVQHMMKEKDQERYYPQLENIARNLVDSIDDFMSLLIAENFMSFLRLFQGESVKANLSKIIMDAFVKRGDETFINDTVILNNLMTIARWLHDSINALTVVDEKRQIGNLLSTFVRRIDFGRDFEQQLEFYVEARGAFFNLDVVHTTLVYRVNKLSFETLRLMKGRHTSRTSAFVRACSAYCFITIPSISSPLVRLQLYMLSGQTALVNQCLGQADAFFKTVIDTIPEIPKHLEDRASEKSSDNLVMGYIKELYSILLVAPDNPTDTGSVFLIRHLSNTLLKYPWDENNAAKISLYIQALHVLSVAYQNEYPYHFLNVDSNDALYASDAQFKNDINDTCSVILQHILKSLLVLGESGQTEKQALLSYELFLCVLLRADVANMEMAKLSVNLWNLANKHETVDKSLAISVLKHCLRSSYPNSKYTEVFSKLLAKLEA